MRTFIVSTALLAAGLVTASVAPAGEHDGEDKSAARPLTVAVFGDWPYSQNLLDNAGLLTGSVNADTSVSAVIHVGDIHSGSMPCTSAGTLPVLPGSVPGWNQEIYFQFQQFNAPLVYTPGDNEWTDCHKSKEKSSGYPLKELASVRQLFFAKPGYTLGRHEKRVWTQARHYDPAFPTDAQFVENVMWQDSGVVFVTLNVPGSNNDTVPWTGDFSDPAAQDEEVANRTAADMRWLQAAFDAARRGHAKAVVVALQADMWDPEAAAPGGDGLDRYTTLVRELADLCLEFGRPVLLLNGDSHLFEADHPLADPSSATGLIHGTPPVPNLTRITVQGSTNNPAEWLRLVIDPRKPQVFSWTNVPYCQNTAGPC
jgi:hypothetical protein